MGTAVWGGAGGWWGRTAGRGAGALVGGGGVKTGLFCGLWRLLGRGQCCCGHWGVVECPVLLLGSCGVFCERVLRCVCGRDGGRILFADW